MRLKDKVAIVTDVAQGIGKVYVLRLSEEGAKVVIADILDGNEVEQAVASKGGQALALHADVIDEESTKEMAWKTAARFGRIDIVINNAAIFV